MTDRIYQMTEHEIMAISAIVARKVGCMVIDRLEKQIWENTQKEFVKVVEETVRDYLESRKE